VLVTRKRAHQLDAVSLQEKPEGAFMQQWGRLLSDSGLETADISAGLADVFSVNLDRLALAAYANIWSQILSVTTIDEWLWIMSVADSAQAKDPAEQLAVKKAAHLAASCWKKYAVQEIEGKRRILLKACHCAPWGVLDGTHHSTVRNQEVPGASAGIIDAEKSVKHSRLSQRIEEAITDPSKCQVTGLKSMRLVVVQPQSPQEPLASRVDSCRHVLPRHHSVWLQVKLKQEMVDIAYPPIIQSGGKYDLKVGRQSAMGRSVREQLLCRCQTCRAKDLWWRTQVNASSSDEKLQYDVIIASLGARYNLYCASLTRTLLVDPSKQQQAEYK
jgi:Metallopeptidase family M24